MPEKIATAPEFTNDRGGGRVLVNALQRLVERLFPTLVIVLDRDGAVAKRHYEYALHRIRKHPHLCGDVLSGMADDALRRESIR